MYSGINLTKNRGITVLLDSIDLTLHPGRITGVISLEPLETSSLLRILSGHDVRAQGELVLEKVSLPRNRPQGFREFGISLTPGIQRIVASLSILDNLILSIPVSRINHPVERVSLSRSMAHFKPFLDKYGLSTSVYTSAGRLSFEDQQKLAIIKCLLEDSDYLLIEEVTSNLSLEKLKMFFQDLKNLRSSGKGILFVPDNPNQVFDLCDEVVVLRNGRKVFHRAVGDVDIEELYNILNNTEYSISQAIENKFHQFRDNITRPSVLLERSMKVLGNFCGYFQCVTYFEEEGRFKVTASKYWNQEDSPPNARTFKAIAAALPHDRDDGSLTWNERSWLWIRVSPQRTPMAIVLIQNSPAQTRAFKQIVKEIRISFEVLERRSREEEEKKRKEIHSIRLDKELDIARHIQNSILPKSLDLIGYEVAAVMETATEVGGDAYEILSTPLGNFIGIGDVSGHGLASGLMALIEMAAFHGVVQTHLKFLRDPEPHIIYDIVNKVLCHINRDRIGSDKFMTKILLVENDGKFIHAGTHEIGLFYKAEEGKVHQLSEMIDRTAFLGLSEFVDSEGSVGSFRMESGDILLLYTDGLIEARNKHSEQFDLHRVESYLQEGCFLPAVEIVKNLRDLVFDFAREGDVGKNFGHLADDLTLLLLRRI